MKRSGREGVFTCGCGNLGAGRKQTSDYTSWYDPPEGWYRWFDGTKIHAACSLPCFEQVRGMSLAEFRDKAREFVNRDRNGTVTMPGGLGCPWCDAESDYDSPDGWYGTCTNGHRWHWLPWGG